jgi:hypothetical protein
VRILDDFSRFGEVKCVGSKAEIGNTLVGVLRRWERQTDRKVKIETWKCIFGHSARSCVERNGIER